MPLFYFNETITQHVAKSRGKSSDTVDELPLERACIASLFQPSETPILWGLFWTVHTTSV